MKNKSSSFMTLAVLVAGLSLTHSLFAAPHPEDRAPEPEFGAPEHRPHHCGEPSPEQRLERMQHELELTDAQVAAIKAIMENTRQQADVIRDSIKPLKDAMHQALTAETPDEQAVRQLSQQLADKKADLMLLRSKTHQQIKAQLTEEQAAQFDAMKPDRHAEHGKGKHRKPPRHG
jgi:Spy/CpxP family protein refolding chaperone